MTFDTDGSIYAVELPGYMRDIEGSDEDAPDGKIVKLTDEDGDGRYDNRTVIKQGLIAPRAVAVVYGGLLYTAGTSLYWDQLDDDLDAELVDSLYVIGGNIEHQPNGLLYNIDNWIYSAKSNARYRKTDDGWQKEATSFRGQWGISHDEHGRLYYNDNSNALYGDVVPPNISINNPYLKPASSIGRQVTKDNRLFLLQATDVNRGYIPGVLDSVTDKVLHFTSACSPHIHTSDGLGATVRGDAFVCGPEGNLVKRYKMNYDGYNISATQAYEGEEFLASTDETFRPVNLYTGADGALYIMDLRKGIIQHRAYMTSYLREKIEARSMDSIIGLGRIYRVYQEGQLTETNWPTEDADWIKELSSSNGARRMIAQKTLVTSTSEELNDQLADYVNTADTWGIIHGLWTLEGRGALSQDLLVELAQQHSDTELWYHLLQLVDESYQEALLTHLSTDYDAMLEPLVAHLQPSDQHQSNGVLAEAAISGMSINELQSYRSQITKGTVMDSLASVTLSNYATNTTVAPQLMTQFFKDPRTAGLQLYNTYCSSCHGQDGMGRENLAPPIMQSEYVNGDVDHLILLMLHGLQGPIKVNGKTYNMNAVMPGIKDNPALGDKEIAEIIVFVRNSFSFANPFDSNILERIGELREQTKDRTEMYTEEELFSWKGD
jgi:mono/diheme cytochrome c family protein